MVFSSSARATGFFARRSSNTWPSFRKPAVQYPHWNAKCVDEGLLQKRKLAISCMTFDGTDRLAVETDRRDDAGRAGVARPVGIVDDDSATQALRGTAAELGAGHPEIFAQEIVHREIVADLSRSVRAAIDRDAQFGHASAPLSRLVGHRQRLEPAAGGIEDGVEDRRHDRNHHDFRHALRRLVRRQRRQHLDLEVAQRQIRSARHQILPEIPLAVAGTTFVGRQVLQQGITDAHRKTALRLAEHDLGHQCPAAFEHAVGLGDAQRTGRALDLDADQRAAHRGVGVAALVIVGRRKFDADPIDARRTCRLRLRTRQRIDLGAILFAAERKARTRPRPAGEAVRDGAGHQIARMRRRGQCRQRQRRQAWHDELPIFPLRLRPIPGARIVRRDAPQFERRRPQAEAEDDARGLRGRMGPHMRADRGAGRRADRRHPARIFLRPVLRLLIHRAGIA